MRLSNAVLQRGAILHFTGWLVLIVVFSVSLIEFVDISIGVGRLLSGVGRDGWIVC